MDPLFDLPILTRLRLSPLALFYKTFAGLSHAVQACFSFIDRAHCFGLYQATMNAADEANQDYESQSTLLDKDGLPLASVLADLSPKLRCGGFRLSSSTDVHRILATATSLRTSDNKRLRLINLRLCTAFHPSNPELPHLEFYFEVMQ
jgi:hypothetical protein